jgi:hypothetical protein
MTKTTSRVVLLVGDLAALFLFAFIGRRAHDLAVGQSAALALLLTAGEFVLAWLLAAWLAGALQPWPQTSAISPGAGGFLRRSLTAWLMAAPLGTLLRALALDRAEIPVTFLLVTLGAGGALVLGWRLIYALAVGRRGERSGAAGSPG